MYENFFEMLHTPFTRDIPAELLYESPYVADAIGRLTYAADRQLFAVVTADAGCGKSTLIRRFVDSLPKDRYIFLYLSDSKLTPDGSIKGFSIRLESNQSSIVEMQNGSFKTRLKSSAEFKTKKLSVFWMKHIFLKKRPLRNLDFC